MQYSQAIGLMVKMTMVCSVIGQIIVRLGRQTKFTAVQEDHLYHCEMRSKSLFDARLKVGYLCTCAKVQLQGRDFYKSEYYNKFKKA